MIYTLTLNPALDRTLTVPHLVLDEVLRASSTQLDWGGKGFNVSRALLQLGQPSTALGFAGGETGQRLERGLKSLGITTDFIRIQGETRTNVVVIEAGSGRHIKVNEPGPQVLPEELNALVSQVSQRAAPGDLWLLCGSLPPGVDPGFFSLLIDLIQSHHAKACLDTSGEPLTLGCTSGPFLVKPNRSEAEEMVGFALNRPEDYRRAALRLFQQGVERLALSLGGDGLFLAARYGGVIARPPAVAVQSTVGAGDAALAGIIYALSHGAALDDVARWGAASGTAAAMKPGTALGSKAEIKQMLEQIQIDIVY